MPPEPNPRDPWRKAPVGELQEQLLPRWFVLLGVVLVPVALIAVIAALVIFTTDEVPVAERRLPPVEGMTNDVGEYRIGTSEPVRYAEACPVLEGVSIAGAEADQQALRLGLNGICNTSLPPVVEDRLSRFAGDGGVIRFAQFDRAVTDSTVLVDDGPPTILLNAKLQSADPLWISPVVVHDAVLLRSPGPSTAAGALEARRAEDLVCDRILGGRRKSPGCLDAEQLLALPDPEAALQDAGYQ